MKTAPWGQDKIIKVDIIEHNSQNTKCESCLYYLTYSYVNRNWILSKWCPVESVLQKVSGFVYHIAALNMFWWNSGRNQDSLNWW